MGAWGPGSFENDDALDWLSTFLDDDDDAILWDQLEYAGALDAPTACATLAAAEVIATAGGHPPPDAPDELLELPREALERETYDLALRAVARVKRSELAELWAGQPEWEAAVGDLEARLTRARGS